MTIEELHAHLGEVKERTQELDAEFAGRMFTPEAQEEYDKLKVERSETEKLIAHLEERKAYAESLVGDDAHTERSFEPKTFNVKVDRGNDIYDLSTIRGDAGNPDKMGDELRDRALRAVEQGNYRGRKDKEAAMSGAERLLRESDSPDGKIARRILVTGHPTYARAWAKAALSANLAGLSSEERRVLERAGLTESDTKGGYAVPFELDPTVILTSDGVRNPIRAISRQESITGDSWKGVSSAGVTAARRAELDEATDDSPTLAQPVITPTSVDVFIPFSIEIGQDWNRLLTEMAKMIQDAKDAEEADSFVNGLGPDTAGNEPAGVVSTLASSSYVDSYALNTFTVSEDVYAVDEALPPRFESNARWLANKRIYNLIRQAANASDGADLWVRLGQGLPPELLGYPAHVASEMASTAVAGDKPLLLGDFDYFCIVDRVGMSVELVPHIFGSARRYPIGQRGIFATWRNSSGILADNAFRLLRIDDTNSDD